MKAAFIAKNINQSAGIPQQAVMTVQRVAALEKVRQGYAAKANVPAAARTLGAMVDAFAKGPSAAEMRNYLRNYMSNGALTSGYSNYQNKMNGLGSTYFNGSNSDSAVKEYAQRVSQKLPALNAYLPKDIAPYARPGVQAASYYYANRVEKVVGSALGATLPLSVSDMDRQKIEAEDRALYLDILTRHQPSVLGVFQGLGQMSDDVRAGLESRAAAADMAAFEKPVSRPSAGQYASATAAASGQMIFTDRQAGGSRAGPAGQRETSIDTTRVPSSGLDFKVNGQDFILFGWNASQTARELVGKTPAEAKSHIDWWFGGTLNNAKNLLFMDKNAVVAGWCMLPAFLKEFTLPDGSKPFWDTLRKKAAEFGWAMDAAWNCASSTSTTYYGSGSGSGSGQSSLLAEESDSSGMLIGVGVVAALFLGYMAFKGARA